MIGIPWKLIGIVAGAAALVAILWWTQSRIRVSYQAEQERDAAIANLSSYQQMVEAAARLAAVQQAADQKADAALTSGMDELQTDNEALRRAVSRISSTVEKHDANGVPRLAINPDSWLCVSIFVSRDATDTAACKTRSGAGEVSNAVGR